MRVLPALALSGALFLGACANPDGSLNVPGTLALGAGAAIAGIAIASANQRPRHGYSRHYDRRWDNRWDSGWRRPSYGYSRPYYISGYHQPRYRSW
ncbi:hypothetical protein [Falsiroseomonas oryziterrae]|uniref:hypothetical protein n=1 Tax=Falsiroseomonas oryziterrae TaxID=2911368 RepID=UPI001F1DB75D|nr:hypothetical protein [Roseomonas sp. NPKOSM-4]